MTGERRDVRVVENGCIGDHVLAREGPVEPVPQLHRHERVHTQLKETDRRRRQRRQPHHRLQFLLQKGRQNGLRIGWLRDAQLR